MVGVRFCILAKVGIQEGIDGNVFARRRSNHTAVNNASLIIRMDLMGRHIATYSVTPTQYPERCLVDCGIIKFVGRGLGTGAFGSMFVSLIEENNAHHVRNKA